MTIPNKKPVVIYISGSGAIVTSKTKGVTVVKKG
jgi:hypothetical protein